MVDLIWMAAREGGQSKISRAGAVESNEYRPGLGVNAGRRVGSDGKVGEKRPHQGRPTRGVSWLPAGATSGCSPRGPGMRSADTSPW